jgi:hypothetical protein
LSKDKIKKGRCKDKGNLGRANDSNKNEYVKTPDGFREE